MPSVNAASCPGIQVMKHTAAFLSLSSTLLLGSHISAQPTQCLIGVLSEDAKFLVFDSNLELLDSGNLWWLGIRSLDGVIKNSTVDMAAIISSGVVNPLEGHAPLHNEETTPFRGVFILPNLGRDYISLEDVSYYEEGIETATWTDTQEGKHLVVSRFDAQFQTKTIYRYNASLELQGEWPSDDLSAGQVVCSAEGKLIVGGLDTRLEISGDKKTLFDIEGLDRDQGFRLTDISDSCKVLAAKVLEPDRQTMPSAIIDIDSGSLVSEFTRDRYIKSSLFDNGGKLLIQDLVAEIAGPNLSRTRVTDNFKVLTTNNGNILIEKTTGTGNAELIGKLSCESGNNDNLFLLADTDRIYLMDSVTLTTTASRKIPFGRKFFLY